MPHLKLGSDWPIYSGVIKNFSVVDNCHYCRKMGALPRLDSAMKIKDFNNVLSFLLYEIEVD